MSLSAAVFSAAMRGTRFLDAEIIRIAGFRIVPASGNCDFRGPPFALAVVMPSVSSALLAAGRLLQVTAETEAHRRQQLVLEVRLAA